MLFVGAAMLAAALAAPATAAEVKILNEPLVATPVSAAGVDAVIRYEIIGSYYHVKLHFFDRNGGNIRTWVMLRESQRHEFVIHGSDNEAALFTLHHVGSAIEVSTRAIQATDQLAAN